MSGKIDLEICLSFLITHVNLNTLCFILQHKFHPDYAYNQLAGENDQDRCRYLINKAKGKGHLDELILYICDYAKKEKLSNGLQEVIIAQATIADSNLKNKKRTKKTEESVDENESKKTKNHKSSSPVAPPNQLPLPSETLLFISIALVVFLIILSFVDIEPYKSLEREYYRL